MSDTDDLLRDGLRALPIPEPAADFDARVLCALHAPPTVWESLWRTVRGDLRPFLAGAACALPVTLLALLWTLHAPATFPVGGNVPLHRVAAARRGEGVAATAGPPTPPSLGGENSMASLDALLDKPDLTSADLVRWRWDTERMPPLPALPPPAPRRRACLPSPPTLAA